MDVAHADAAVTRDHLLIFLLPLPLSPLFRATSCTDRAIASAVFYNLAFPFDEDPFLLSGSTRVFAHSP